MSSCIGQEFFLVFDSYLQFSDHLFQQATLSGIEREGMSKPFKRLVLATRSIGNIILFSCENLLMVLKKHR
jgi:hypothetical protein